MSIADKLTYLNQTKQLIKESINLTGANITNEPFRDYAVMLRNKLPELVGNPSPIWFNYEHVSGSGTSFSINSYNSIFNYNIKGDTVQNGTPTPDAPIPVNVVSGDNKINITGKNLLNRATCEENKLIRWVQGDTYYETGSLVSDYIRINGGETIYTSYSCQVAFYDKNKTYIGVLNANGTIVPNGTNAKTSSPFNIPNDVDNIYYIRLGFRASYTTGVNLLTANIMVNKGDTLATYEPYQGQSYAVNLGSLELCKIGNYQDYIFRNDNLIDYMAEPSVNDCTYQYVEGGIRIITNGEGFDEGIGIPIKGLTVGKKYYARINVTSMTPSGDNNVIYAGVSNSTYTQSMDTNVPAQLSMEFTPNQSDVELGIYSDVYPVNSIDFTVKDIFIGVINEYNPAEPHGKWYLHKEIGKVVLDGSENYLKSLYSDTNYCTFMTNDFNSLIKEFAENIGTPLMSNYFTHNNSIGSSIPNITGISYRSSAYGIRIAIEYSNASDVSGFQNWLSTHNTLVYYILATPTNTEITDANLILQLNSVRLVNGLNNIITVGSDLNPLLNIDAIKHLD